MRIKFTALVIILFWILLQLIRIMGNNYEKYLSRKGSRLVERQLVRHESFSLSPTRFRRVEPTLLTTQALPENLLSRLSIAFPPWETPPRRRESHGYSIAEISHDYREPNESKSDPRPLTRLAGSRILAQDPIPAVAALVPGVSLTLDDDADDDVVPRVAPW